MSANPFRASDPESNMSDTTASLRRKIGSAGDLQSVVRTMKALAASSIGQYEKSVRALGDYYRTVELGLGACFRKSEPLTLIAEPKTRSAVGAIGEVVFGSDQGLVGQFNHVVAEFAIQTLAALPGTPHVWAVGERVHARLADAGLPLAGLFTVPNSVQGVTPLLREYLFVSLFRACAESLASENASRLVAMERADRNIDELLETLNGRFHRLRQSGIDEELSDVISGFESPGGAHQAHPCASR
jgi:F-type H+-transporting ATPase subunit gamma